MAGSNWETWVKANGKWLAAAAAGLVILSMMAGGDETQGSYGDGTVVGSQDGGGPYGQGGYPDGSMPYDSGRSPDGGFDMDKWREEQAIDDAQQRERIDRIREVDRCTDSETGEQYEVPSHLGC